VSRIFAGLRVWAEVVGSFYRRPVAWAGLLVSSALLSYGGGAVMFWFHAVFRGEAGPAIADLNHWLLDSSLGFIALTPVLALILPLGAQLARNSANAGRRCVGLWSYVVAVAGLFTLTTGPGPFLHGKIAGAGTPLARLATTLFGHDAAIAARNMHVHDRSPLAEGLLQILVGFPVYLACTWLALRLVRGVIRHTRRLTRGPVDVPPADTARTAADDDQARVSVRP